MHRAQRQVDLLLMSRSAEGARPGPPRRPPETPRWCHPPINQHPPQGGCCFSKSYASHASGSATLSLLLVLTTIFGAAHEEVGVVELANKAAQLELQRSSVGEMRACSW